MKQCVTGKFAYNSRTFYILLREDTSKYFYQDKLLKLQSIIDLLTPYCGEVVKVLQPLPCQH